MKYVIDIDENVFTRLFDNGTEDYEISNDDLSTITKAIRNGKPLPKGHGRLIDADALKKKAVMCPTVGNTETLLLDIGDVENAPTIIKADKVCTYKETGCGSCRWQIECPYDEADEEGTEE